MLPPTPQPPPKPATPTWVVILLFLIVLIIAAGIGALARSLWILPPIDAVATSSPSSAPVSSGPAFDPTASAALVQIAQAFSTSVAPTVTPLPPTPTYALATEIPPVTCGSWAAPNQPCEMPPAPLPTATALPDCPVAPKLSCIWRGSLGSPVVPTPAVNVGSPWSPT